MAKLKHTVIGPTHHKRPTHHDPGRPGERAGRGLSNARWATDQGRPRVDVLLMHKFRGSRALRCSEVLKGYKTPLDHGASGMPPPGLKGAFLVRPFNTTCKLCHNAGGGGGPSFASLSSGRSIIPVSKPFRQLPRRSSAASATSINVGVSLCPVNPCQA